MDRQRLAGKVALITGARYGMGQSMGELFSEEGAAVALTARNKEQLDEVVEKIRAKGGKAIGIVSDISKKEDTTRVFDEIIREPNAA